MSYQSTELGGIMNIVMINANHVRAQKISTVLRYLGFSVLGLCYNSLTPESKLAFTQTELYATPLSLAGVLSPLPRNTIVHVFHEPAWMVMVAKQLGFKVIMDVGDLELVRTGQKELEEVAALQSADSLIYNSDNYPQFVNEAGLEVTKDVVNLFPYNCSKDYKQPTFKQGGIAYGGKVHPPWAIDKVQYRNIEPIVEGIAKLKIPFHIYPSAMVPGIMHYKTIDPKYVFLYETVPYETLLLNLRRHHWGLIGCPIKNHRFMDNVVPQKLFDYIAVGLPIIVYNSKRAAEFVKKYDIGIVVDDLKEIKERYDEWKIFAKNVIKVRDSLSIEQNIFKITELYNKLELKEVA